jgi:dihydropteroate synthase
MKAFHRTITTWKLHSRTLELGRRTLIMGVVNVTPDSFSDGGQFLDPSAAIAHGISLLDEGADFLDLGAESTRPGVQAGGGEGAVAGTDEPQLSPTVSTEEEQARLLPVIEGILASRPDAILSIDTYKAATARAALGAGAQIVNDVSGFLWDEEMATVCADCDAAVVLMHTRGKPEEWREQTQLPPNELLATVRAGLEASVERAADAGVAWESIVLDPGFGFGKKYEENFCLLARQAELLSLTRPLVSGVSRKSFLGRSLAPLFDGGSAPVDARETASQAAMVTAILHGASVVRVHRVRPAVEAALVADAVLAAYTD